MKTQSHATVTPINLRDLHSDKEIAKKFGMTPALFRKQHCRPSQIGQIIEHADGSRYQFIDEHTLYRTKGLWLALPAEPVGLPPEENLPAWLMGEQP